MYRSSAHIIDFWRRIFCEQGHAQDVFKGNEKKVVFLCVENSSRSHISKGLARTFFPYSIEPCSDGNNAGDLNPVAVAASEEIGIDISGQRAKSLDDVAGISFDMVIIL